MATTKKTAKKTAKRATVSKGDQESASAKDAILYAIDKINEDDRISSHEFCGPALTGLRKSLVWLDRIEGQNS